MEFDGSFAFEESESEDSLREISDADEVLAEATDPVSAGEVQTEVLKRNRFFEKPVEETVTQLRLASLNLSKPLLKACDALRYTIATPIQAAAIPLILSGRDICGSAITGSGKTAAFGLPLLERLLYRPVRVATTYVLIVAPTRELAAQIHDVMGDLAQFTNIQVALMVGGFSLQVQAATLDTHPEIVVGTPGRLIDHLRNSRSFDLESVQAVVLDEADKLLKMGFINEIKEILKHLPKARQTMLFSATMTEEVKKLMQLSLNRPVRIAADPSGRAPRKLTQEIIRLKGDEMRKQKEAILCALCSRTFAKGRVIIFCASKSRAHRIKLLFEMLQLPPTGELHSNMSQSSRLESLEKFRNHELAYLVATDVAGRGLDIVGVEVVINYDAPPSLDTYLHRIGRTARAGAAGQAVTFIGDTNRALVKEILAATQQKLTSRIIPPETIVYYSQQLQLHQRHLKLVVKQEVENEKLSRAEMEAERAKNVIEHEKEIFAKPPRTWFQTNEERKETQKLARMEENGLFKSGAERPQKGKGGKKSKTLKKGEQRAQQNPEMAETKAIKGKVRAIKQLHRMYEEQGSTSKGASRRALASLKPSKGVKHERDAEDDQGFLKAPSKLQNKSKRPRTNASTELLAQEAAGKSHVYAGGAKSSRIKTLAVNKKKANLSKRGGKGKHAFKGKSKFKRR